MPGIRYDLDLETESFRRGAAQSMDYINQLHGRIDRLSQAGGGAGGNSFLKGLSTTLFQLPQQVLALQGLMSGLTLASKLAASAETTSVAFRTLVGDTEKADAALARVRKMADSTPFEFPELADAARKLIAFGEGSETVADTLRKVGDVASGISAPLGDIAEIYGNARVAGTLFAEDINQLTGRGIPIIQEFAKQLNISEGAVKKLASEGGITFPMLEQAFTDMTSGAGKFSGMMDATSRTMEGRLSTLGDSFKGAMTAVGVGLNEAIKPLVSGAAEKIDGLKDKAAELGRDLGKAVNFGVAAFKLDAIGPVILKGFQAGGLAVSDSIVKGLSWGADYLLSKIMQSPLASQDVQDAGAAYEKTLKEAGMDTPGLGVQALSDASSDAAKSLAATIQQIKNVADINESNGKREEATRQAQAAANRNRAATEAYFTKAFKATEIAPAAGPQLLPPPATPDQGPGLPDPPQKTADRTLRSAGSSLMQGGGGVSGGIGQDKRKGYGTHQIKGAGFKGVHQGRMETPDPETLGQQTGRGQAARSRRAGAAEAAQAKAQMSASNSGSDALLKKIAADVAQIAKSKKTGEHI